MCSKGTQITVHISTGGKSHSQLKAFLKTELYSLHISVTLLQNLQVCKLQHHN